MRSRRRDRLRALDFALGLSLLRQQPDPRDRTHGPAAGALMAVQVIFRCERCAKRPDAATQRALAGHLRDRTIGEYRDALPGGWLIWTAGGPHGSKRYACREHRRTLVASLRRSHDGVRWGVWRDEPYPASWPDGLRGLDERDLAALLAPDGPAPARTTHGTGESR